MLKKTILIVAMMFSPIFAQEYIYLDFFGIEDSLSNTHLVYRKHFSDYQRSYYKLDLRVSQESFIAYDGIQTTPHSITGQRIRDI